MGAVVLLGAELALQQPILRRADRLDRAVRAGHEPDPGLMAGTRVVLRADAGRRVSGVALPCATSAAKLAWRERFYDFFSTSFVFGALAAGYNAMGLLPRLEYNRLSNVAGGSYDGLGSAASVTGGWQAGHTVFEHVTRNSYYPGGIAIALAVIAVS